MNKQTSMQTIFGQPSFVIEGTSVRLAVTWQGGHMAPVEFRGTDGDQTIIQPYSIAPWWNETLPEDLPPILKVLRGDFFCMPFGGNATPFQGECHPVHGEVANNEWTGPEWTKGNKGAALTLKMQTHVRPGTVTKRIAIIDGHEVVYCQHRIEGMEGPMCLGHHACIRFPDKIGSGHISFSRFVHGQVFPEPVETPETQGRSILQPGAVFSSLKEVPLTAGPYTDLSRYPARPGYEDIAMIITDPNLPTGWSTVAFPDEGYVWYALKDPKVLAGTVMWISNGGRDAVPWTGRHINVMGLEDVTSYFHCGLAESAGDNPFRRQGFQTTLQLSREKPTVVNYIMGVARVPRGFGGVWDVQIEGDAFTLIGETGGRVAVPVAVEFLSHGNVETLIGA